MKTAIFADVHANLKAMEAFVRHIAGHNVDRFFFLGDIVGYGNQPGECIEILRSLPNLHAVLGNHDDALLWRTSPYQMTETAREAIFWTMSNTKDSHLSFLKSLEYNIIENGTCYSHTQPCKSTNWGYINNRIKAFMVFKSSPHQLAFIGHTHFCQAYCLRNNWKVELLNFRDNQTIKLRDGERWIINGGSVGRPRDGGPASYCIYNEDENSVSFHRFYVTD